VNLQRGYERPPVALFKNQTPVSGRGLPELQTTGRGGDPRLKRSFWGFPLFASGLGSTLSGPPRRRPPGRRAGRRRALLRMLTCRSSVRLLDEAGRPVRRAVRGPGS